MRDEKDEEIVEEMMLEMLAVVEECTGFMYRMECKLRKMEQLFHQKNEMNVSTTDSFKNIIDMR